jgi:hypothetical protein
MPRPTATITPGDPRPPPAHAEDDDDAGQPDGQRGTVRPAPRQALDEVADLGQQPAAVDGEPEQLGELPDDDRHRDSVQVAELHRPRQQLGHEPQAREAGDQDHHPGEDRQHAGQGDGPLRVPAGQRQDDRRDHRRQRGVGAEHHHPGRPEDRVRHQRHDGGVQPGDRGEPGRLRVAHAHRDQ